MFSRRFKNLLSSRTRREEIKRPLSESAVDSFFMSSRHLTKNVFPMKCNVFKEIQEFTIVSNPKGGNQAPSIRIRCRLIFHVFSTSYEKRFSHEMQCFQGDSRIYYRLEPEGRKSSALYQNPLSTHFSCLLDILRKTFFP